MIRHKTRWIGCLVLATLSSLGMTCLQSRCGNFQPVAWAFPAVLSLGTLIGTLFIPADPVQPRVVPIAGGSIAAPKPLAEVRFCPTCGARAGTDKTACFSCGHELPMGAGFCPGCGKAV